MFPRPIVEAFDVWLSERSLRFEAVVIGGSALALLDVVDRPTRDLDVLVPEIPTQIKSAASDFAVEMRNDGVQIDDDWLNNGPAQLVDVLPDGWRNRTREIFTGSALTLTTLAREDLLKTKLFALCDRGTDLPDCVALSPSALELVAAEPWLAHQDAHPSWPEHVKAVLEDLRARIEGD